MKNFNNFLKKMNCNKLKVNDLILSQNSIKLGNDKGVIRWFLHASGVSVDPGGF